MAEPKPSAPATRSQPTRKGKRAWRKNVDISEIQAGLETAREEIILTGGVIAEKPASDLFLADVTGDSEIAKQQQQQGKKVLKAAEILAQRSAVPGLSGRKRKIVEPGLGSNKKHKNGTYVPRKELQRLRNVADNAVGGVKVDAEGATYDPWSLAPSKVRPELDFLAKKRPVTEPKTLKHAPIALTADGKLLPAVLKPAAGKSYNPQVDDWFELLEREGTAAVVAEQKRLADEIAEAARQARLAAEAAKVEAQERAEYGTDHESAWESEWDGFQSGGDETFTQKPQRRKTLAERKKVIARKEKKGRQKHDRAMREREKQERRIGELLNEAREKDRAREAIVLDLQRRSSIDSDGSDEFEVDVDVLLRRARFGKLPVPDAPLELVLPDELQDSLRRLKPEGNLMNDRWRNLLINGKMEIRRARGEPKQARVERKEKWTYKDWKLR